MGMMFFKKEIPQIEKIDIGKELPAIPEESVERWKQIPVRECGEKLVPVGAFSGFSDCDTSAVYFGERGKDREMNFLGKAVNQDVSLITHFVREGVLERLKNAQNLLPDGYYFRFLDNYRSLDVQQALYDDQREKFRKVHPEWTGAQLEEETQKYVSLPSPNKERGTTHPSPHSTGGVVDLIIIKMSPKGQERLAELGANKWNGELNYPITENEEKEHKEVLFWINDTATRREWNEAKRRVVLNRWLVEYRYAREKARIFKDQAISLNMGTDFDHFGPEAGTCYFEELAKQRELSESEKETLQNRRFLYQVMTKAGFSNYPEEWWHWSFGDNMDAANCKKEFAVYGGIELSKENLAFEEARRGPYFDALGRIGKKGLFIDSIEGDPTELAV